MGVRCAISSASSLVSYAYRVRPAPPTKRNVRLGNPLHDVSWRSRVYRFLSSPVIITRGSDYTHFSTDTIMYTNGYSAHGRYAAARCLSIRLPSPLSFRARFWGMKARTFPVCLSYVFEDVYAVARKSLTLSLPESRFVSDTFDLVSEKNGRGKLSRDGRCSGSSFP